MWPTNRACSCQASVSQASSACPAEPVSSSAPLGVNVTARTAVCVRRNTTGFFAARSQTRKPGSAPAETISGRVGWKARAVTSPAWSVQPATSFPVATSHTLTSPGPVFDVASEPLAKSRPSGENARQATCPRCDSKAARSRKSVGRTPGGGRS